MNTDTISAMMNMTALQSLGSSGSSNSSSGGGSGMDFSAVLTSMLGAETGGVSGASSAADLLAGLDASTGVDYSALLSSITGMRVQDVQMNDATAQALEALLGAERPLVNDPVLAQLLQALKNLAGDGAEGGDVLDLIGQMQKRLMEMLEESGNAMASQEALALMSQLMPLFTGQATAESMTESLNAAGGEAALELMLQRSPEDLVSLMGGQTAQQAAQTQAPTQVLPPEAAGTSQAQADFSQVAQAAASGDTAGDPRPVDPQSAGAFRVESVETQSAEQPQTLAQLLETGKAQGNFASAVRTVKDQMADSESKGFGEELDADELQRQVDASSVNQTVRTAQVAEAPQEVRETPQPVPVQMQEAITKALAAGEEQIVVKLNPQDLGEVTIQMQKAADGSLLLNIIARNPETQRLLAGEMAQLQQNMKPLNVEVASITTEEQYQMANAQQQFGGQHQRSWKEMHGASYFGDEPLSAQAAEAEQAMAQAVQAAPATILDAYI